MGGGMSTLVEESLAFLRKPIEAALNEGFVCQKENRPVADAARLGAKPAGCNEIVMVARSERIISKRKVNPDFVVIFAQRIRRFRTRGQPET
jgi:hypothetical protein